MRIRLALTLQTLQTSAVLCAILSVEPAHVNQKQTIGKVSVYTSRSFRRNQVQPMDSSRVSLVSLALKESAFTDDKCESPVLQSQALTERWRCILKLQGFISPRHVVLDVLPGSSMIW